MWMLLLAAYSADLIDALAIALGVREEPRALLSHSIPAALLTAVIGTLLYYLTVRTRSNGGFDWHRSVRGAALLAAVFLSHVGLDYVTGNKPSWPGGPTIGLTLYHRPLADFAIEVSLLLICWLAYRRLRGDRTLWASPIVLAGLVLVQMAWDVFLAVTPFADPVR